MSTSKEIYVQWRIFTGTGEHPSAADAWRAIPDPPPWRDRTVAVRRFVITEPLLDAVNAALHLRRPLLITGPPGSGKSTLVSLIAVELQLGEPLNWHITSRSTLNDALYQYDALGRLHATQAGTDQNSPDAGRVEHFVTLGPLGTALASQERPRAVLIDEIDKSDLDLPGDLLNVLEQGEFDIPPLVRDARLSAAEPLASVTHRVRGADREIYDLVDGVVRRTHIPVIVLTSNGERTFPPPFLRRCVRFEMPTPQESFVRQVVAAYLDDAAEREQAIIHEFAERLVQGQNLALDQLLNLIYLVTGEAAPDTEARKRVEQILLAELSGR
jgi:MoxR-like ATPase